MRHNPCTSAQVKKNNKYFAQTNIKFDSKHIHYFFSQKIRLQNDKKKRILKLKINFNFGFCKMDKMSQQKWILQFQFCGQNKKFDAWKRSMFLIYNEGFLMRVSKCVHHNNSLQIPPWILTFWNDIKMLTGCEEKLKFS